ncbi:MAG: T9SS type A sorting domain-containing protein [bacterium]
MKCAIKLICFIILVQNILWAGEISKENLQKDLPKLLGSSNIGTEFFLTFHPGWMSTVDDYCYIYVTSQYATKVTLKVPGKDVNMEGTISPNGVLEFRIDLNSALCYQISDRDEPKPEQVFKGNAIIVTSEKPIVCYGFFRNRDVAEGFSALPLQALGQKYIVSSYNSPVTNNGGQYLPSYTSIVGVYDQTEVEVTLSGNPLLTYTSGQNPMKGGEKRTSILNSGDVWLIGAFDYYADVTGSVVNADKPVAVISGSYAAALPISSGMINYIIEQDLPMESWGNEYQVTNLANRKKGSIIRVFASEPNTVILRDGKEWAFIKTVGGVIDTGFIERRANDVNSGEILHPITISSSNKIAVTQYNPGAPDDGSENDPFQIALIPINKYQNHLLFALPGTLQGASSTVNYLNLCYKATEKGTIPDDMEIGKATDGKIIWQKLNEVAQNQGLEFASEKNETRKYRAVTLKIDDSVGVYQIRAKEPFGAYLYGFKDKNTYGYALLGNFEESLDSSLTLTTPPNNSENVSSYCPFKWYSHIKANSYRFELATDTDFNNIVYDINLKETIFTPPNKTDQNVKYYWRVTALDANSNIVGKSETWNFKTEALTLLEPKNEAIEILVNTSFKWLELKDVKNYELEISKDIEFNEKLSYTTNETSYTLTTALDYYTKYYWRVKGNYENGDFAQSPTYNFSTESNINVQIIYPANNSKNIEFNPKFKWSKIDGAVGYRFEVSTDKDFNNFKIANFIYGQDSTFFYNAIDSLEENTTYYWRVRAKLKDFYSKWSEISSFKSIKLITPISPANNSDYIPVNTDFIWSKFEGATQYQMVLNFYDGSNYVKQMFMTNDTTLHLYEPINAYGFTWQVRPIINSDTLSWSRINTYNINLGGMISAIAPKQYSQNNSLVPKLVWKKFDGAIGYQVKLIHGNNQKMIISTEEPEYQIVDSLNYEDWAMWYIRPLKKEGYGLWSPEYAFQTEAKAIEVELLYPADNESYVEKAPKLDWTDVKGALEYELRIIKSYVGDSPNFKTTKSEFQIEEFLLPNKAIWWKLRALTKFGYTTWSKTSTFYTGEFGNSITSEDAGNMFRILPNPVKDNLILENTMLDAVIKSISILNMSGCEILSKQINRNFVAGNNYTIDCSALPNGAYTVLIDIGDRTIMKRFIIAK